MADQHRPSLFLEAKWVDLYLDKDGGISVDSYELPLNEALSAWSRLGKETITWETLRGICEVENLELREGASWPEFADAICDGVGYCRALHEGYLPIPTQAKKSQIAHLGKIVKSLIKVLALLSANGPHEKIAHKRMRDAALAPSNDGSRIPSGSYEDKQEHWQSELEFIQNCATRAIQDLNSQKPRDDLGHLVAEARSPQAKPEALFARYLGRVMTRHLALHSNKAFPPRTINNYSGSRIGRYDGPSVRVAERISTMVRMKTTRAQIGDAWGRSTA
jgi:hypothetical protein